MKDMTSTEKEQLRELNHKDRRARTCAKLNLEEATHSGRQMQALIPILVKEFETRTFDHNSMIKHMETIEQEARRILESVLRAKSKVLEAQEALELHLRNKKRTRATRTEYFNKQREERKKVTDGSKSKSKDN